VHADTGRTQINREQLGRFLALKCNIEGRDMGTFVDDAQRRVADAVTLPGGYYMTWGGEFENQRRAMQQLALIVPVSIAAIFMLLYWTFNAVLPAAVVLAGLPFAAVGGVFALALTHTTLSVSAAIGFITLFGVATMDGVLLITYVRQARLRHGDHAEQAILAAVSQRLRPVLMTALLASLGLLPAAMSHAIGSDTQRPFAIVIIGGLVSSTFLTMLLLPTLYDLFDRVFGRRRNNDAAA
jgi:cobalt-zinc-cadmium resistance protein CzcA